MIRLRRLQRTAVDYDGLAGAEVSLVAGVTLGVGVLPGAAVTG